MNTLALRIKTIENRLKRPKRKGQRAAARMQGQELPVRHEPLLKRESINAWTSWDEFFHFSPDGTNLNSNLYNYN